MRTTAVAPNIAASLLREFGPSVQHLEDIIIEARGSFWKDQTSETIWFKRESLDTISFIIENNHLTNKQLTTVIEEAYTSHKEIDKAAARVERTRGKITGYHILIFVVLK